MRSRLVQLILHTLADNESRLRLRFCSRSVFGTEAWLFSVPASFRAMVGRVNIYTMGATGGADCLLFLEKFLGDSILSSTLRRDLYQAAYKFIMIACLEILRAPQKVSLNNQLMH